MGIDFLSVFKVPLCCTEFDDELGHNSFNKSVREDGSEEWREKDTNTLNICFLDKFHVK